MTVMKAARIVNVVLVNLADRKGFDAWWDSIDPDVRKDLLEDLKAVVQRELDRTGPASLERRW